MKGGADTHMTVSMMEHLESMGITEGMVTSTVITIILCVVAILAGRNMQMIPSGLQNVAEMAIGKMYSFFEGIMGKKLCKQYFPIIATLFIYILFCNYSGLLPASGELPGLQAPTSSLNCTSAMAIFVFFMTTFVGLRANRGPKFFKHLFKPVAFLFPLMIVEMLVRPLSLMMRLYGNIYGEETVTHHFFTMIPIGLPVVMQLLSVLMGLSQALVVSLLTAIYFTEAGEVEGELDEI